MTAEATHLQRHVGASFQSRLALLQTRMAGKLRLGLRAEFTRYGLCRDLAQPLQKPNAKIPIIVRPLQNDDLPLLFATDSSQSIEERLQVAWRLAFVEKNPRGGFVAVDTRNDTPCYVQWLFGARDNEFIRSLGGFPTLEPHQALLENAYTPPRYRGLGIMSAAMALIAEHGSNLGARHVLTFVDIDNIPSLKGCQRAGFYPDLLHHRTRFVFGLVTSDRFEKLPESDPRLTTKF
jgi:RimJ/RimL family protein N-acetyltransferase